MVRETDKARRARARRLVAGVLAAQPDARCALDFETPFQLLVATILSAQNTDENVNRVTPRLFSRFPDPQAMATADPDQLQELIHSTGFFRQKTKSLLRVSQALVDEHGGEVPDTLDELVRLPGVGRKTANLVLGVCFGVPGLVIDTHAGRLARRWGLTEHKDAGKIERDLMPLVPAEQWTAFSHATIFHGRRVCHARKPSCGECGLRVDCPSADVGGVERGGRVRGAGLWLLLGAVAFAAACSGEGSDIGPRIVPVSEADYRVIVVDDSYRRAVNARVTIDGASVAGAVGRNGRAVVPALGVGRGRVTVDGAAASATASSELGRLVVDADLSDGGELPYVVFLPDVAGSAGLVLPAGPLGGGAQLDDSASSGGIVTIAAGTAVAAGSSSTITLRTGMVSAHHLPGELPAAASGVRVWSRGVYLHPPDLTLAPSAGLAVVNDQGFAAGAAADLYWLEPATGRWQRVAGGSVDGSGALVQAGAGVAAAGLYAFAVDAVAPTTQLIGRLLDLQDRGVPDGLVRAGAGRVRSRGDGRFTLPPIAAVDGSGAARTVTLDAFGGRDWLPVRAASTVTLTPGVQDLGDLRIETATATQVRLQLINRGRIDPWRRLRVSSGDDPTFGIGVGDANGERTFHDQAGEQFVGVLTTRIQDDFDVLVAQAFRFLKAGEHHADLQVFGNKQPWWIGRGRGGATATYVVDALGTGPIRFAAVTRDAEPERGFLGYTRETGVVNGAYGDGGQATAAIATGATGSTVVSAFTMVDVDSARIEVPLQRARQFTGAFDAHGVVRGAVTLGAASGVERRVSATRTLTREDWYEAVFFDREIGGDVPRREDPALTGGRDFVLGVPLPAGNLAAVEVASSPTGSKLQRLGFVGDLMPDPGGAVTRDVPLTYAADTAFTVADALTNLHGSLSFADVTYDLGIEFADGRVLDAGRDLGGLRVAGTSLVADLPALVGGLQGARYLVAFDARSTGGGVEVRQQTFAPLDGGPAPFVRFLDVPSIVAPAPGAVVSADGFTVQWTVPVSTLYVVVNLRAENGAVVRDWTAVLPASFDRFSFRRLPVESPQPLIAGTTWRLSVTAARIETGVLSRVRDPYRRILQNWVGITAAEREVNAFSTTAITVTTN